MDGQGDS